MSASPNFVDRPLATEGQAYRVLEPFIANPADGHLPRIDSTEFTDATIPTSVREHFLAPDPLAEGVFYSARTELLRRQSNPIWESGLYLANVYFLQTEVINPDRKHITRVGYHIRREPFEGLKWERRIVMAVHVKESSIAVNGLGLLLDGHQPIDLRAHLEGLKERERQLYSAEEEVGLNTVYRGEAAEVVAFCRDTAGS